MYAYIYILIGLRRGARGIVGTVDGASERRVRYIRVEGECRAHIFCRVIWPGVNYDCREDVIRDSYNPPLIARRRAVFLSRENCFDAEGMLSSCEAVMYKGRGALCIYSSVERAFKRRLRAISVEGESRVSRGCL